MADQYELAVEDIVLPSVLVRGAAYKVRIILPDGVKSGALSLTSAEPSADPVGVVLTPNTEKSRIEGTLRPSDYNDLPAGLCFWRITWVDNDDVDGGVAGYTFVLTSDDPDFVHDAKMLAMVRTALEAKMERNDVVRYTIADRELFTATHEELYAMRRRYSDRIRRRIQPRRAW